jgi:hypothetical protein
MRVGLLLCVLACSAPESPASTVTSAGSSGAHSSAVGGTGGTGGTIAVAQGGQAGATPHTAGTAGGGTTPVDMLTLKQPIERDGKLVLEFGSTYFAVDPGHGARIVSLRVADHELLKLTGAANFADAFGSTFWPSPQSWPWPPPAELDVERYTARVDAPHTLVLTSEPHEGTRLRVSKSFMPDLTREALLLEYAMTNTGDAAISWAPWEITRMPADGLAFWPTGGSPFGDSPLAHQAALGHTWCSPAQTEGEAKLFADGAGGYLAYATGGSILIKQFADIPAVAAAPDEAELELYVNADHSYVEVENQGAYASIAPGQTVRWQVTWYARRLPPGVSVTAGNADLIAFVRETLQ